MIPSVIGRYEIESLVAEGGMGEVFLARDPLVKRRVAVKLLKRVLCDDPNIRSRFAREAEAIAALEHPAIVPIYDFGEHGDQLFYVMRYVAGGTLKDKLAVTKTMPLREVARVVDRVAEALSAAHGSGLVHRDIKPANILFDERGTAYLSDFGIVKAQKAIDETETGNMMMGTPQYLSPEQALSAPVDARSDVYSLGVVAYQAITGEPPFLGKTPMAVTMAHVMEPPPPIRERLPSLPSVTDEVFSRVLAKEPDARYPSAAAFAKDVRDIASGRWYLVKIASNMLTPKPGKLPEPPPPEPPAPPRKVGDTGEFFVHGRPFGVAKRGKKTTKS